MTLLGGLEAICVDEPVHDLRARFDRLGSFAVDRIVFGGLSDVTSELSTVDLCSGGDLRLPDEPLSTPLGS